MSVPSSISTFTIGQLILPANVSSRPHFPTDRGHDGRSAHKLTIILHTPNSPMREEHCGETMSAIGGIFQFHAHISLHCFYKRRSLSDPLRCHPEGPNEKNGAVVMFAKTCRAICPPAVFFTLFTAKSRSLELCSQMAVGGGLVVFVPGSACRQRARVCESLSLLCGL